MLRRATGGPGCPAGGPGRGSWSHIHAAEPQGQLQVAGEQGDALGVDRTQVGVGQHHHQEGLGRLENHREPLLHLP